MTPCFLIAIIVIFFIFLIFKDKTEQYQDLVKNPGYQSYLLLSLLFGIALFQAAYACNLLNYTILFFVFGLLVITEFVFLFADLFEMSAMTGILSQIILLIIVIMALKKNNKLVILNLLPLLIMNSLVFHILIDISTYN